MASFIAIAKTALELLPVVIVAMKALESAIPQAGYGADKLQVIRKSIEEVYATSETVMPDIEKVWNVLQKSIGALVILFNKVGW